jgi:hypothetical protein
MYLLNVESSSRHRRIQWTFPLPNGYDSTSFSRGTQVLHRCCPPTALHSNARNAPRAHRLTPTMSSTVSPRPRTPSPRPSSPSPAEREMRRSFARSGKGAWASSPRHQSPRPSPTSPRQSPPRSPRHSPRSPCADVGGSASNAAWQRPTGGRRPPLAKLSPKRQPRVAAAVPLRDAMASADEVLSVTLATFCADGSDDLTYSAFVRVARRRARRGLRRGEAPGGPLAPFLRDGR